MRLAKKTRIFLLNPPFRRGFSRSQRSPAVTKSGTLYYPIWLSYATGLLEEAGYEVRLLDAPAQDLTREECYRDIKAFKPNLIILDTSTASISNDLEVARGIKNNIDCKVVLVGTHVSVLGDGILEKEDHIDFVARREYEYTLLELSEAIENNDPGRSVQGLSLKIGKDVIHNPDREYEKDLDRLPFVSKTYKKHLSYKSYNYSITRYPVMTIMTSRGCPFKCRFCLYPQVFTGHEFRVRSIDNVIEELRYIKAEFPGIRDVFFEDDTFTLNKGRVHELCDRIVKEKLRITWTANARADLDYELLKHMKTAGNRLLCVGFESCNRAVMKKIEKNINIENMRQFAENARKAGVLIHGCFVFGNPGDARETFEETLKFAKRLPLSSAQFFPAMAYPGTELYDELKGQKLLLTNDYSKWVDEDGFHSTVISYPDLSSKEILNFCNNAKLGYHFRLAFFLSKLIEIARMPQELPRNFRSMITLLRNGIRGYMRNPGSSQKRI